MGETDSLAMKLHDLNEINVGPFTFEYNPDRYEMYISRGEEQIGYCEYIWLADWKEFLADVMA